MMKKVRNSRKTRLPVYRIKTIMKAAPNVSQVSGDAYFLMTKATELFIAHLTEESHKKAEDDNLEYKDVADVVQFNDVYDFLRELIPRKITVRRYKELMEEKAKSSSKDDSTYFL